MPEGHLTNTYPLSLCLLIHRIDNGLPLNEETEGSGQSNDGLYEAIVRVKIPKISLKSPTAINCVLTIPGTNYTKKRETIYYGKLSAVFFLLLPRLLPVHGRFL